MGSLRRYTINHKDGKIMREILNINVGWQFVKDTVDIFGDVYFYVPQHMNYADPAQDLYISLRKGQQHLDGDKAEQLVRFRQYKNGDLGRIKVQQDFIHAVAEQKLSAKYIGSIGDVYEIIIDNMETLMSPNDFVQCGTQLLSIGTGNIETITLPVSMVDGKPYVLPNYDDIAEVRENSFGYDKFGNDI